MADKDDRDTSLSGKSNAGPGRGSSPGGKTVSSSKGSTASRSDPRSDTPSSAKSVGSNLGSGKGDRVGKSTTSNAGAGRGKTPGGPSLNARSTANKTPTGFDATRFGERYGVANIKSTVNPITSMRMASTVPSPARSALDRASIAGPTFSRTGIDMNARPSLDRKGLGTAAGFARDEYHTDVGLTPTQAEAYQRTGMPAATSRTAFARDVHHSNAVDPYAAEAYQRTGMPAATLPDARSIPATGRDRFGPTVAQDTAPARNDLTVAGVLEQKAQQQRATVYGNPAPTSLPAAPTVNPLSMAANLPMAASPAYRNTIRTTASAPRAAIPATGRDRPDVVAAYAAQAARAAPEAIPPTGRDRFSPNFSGVSIAELAQRGSQVAGVDPEDAAPEEQQTAAANEEFEAPVPEVVEQQPRQQPRQPVVQQKPAQKQPVQKQQATFRQAVVDLLTPNPTKPRGLGGDIAVTAADTALDLTGPPGWVNRGIQLATGKSVPGHVWAATHGEYGPNQYAQGSQHRSSETSGDGSRQAETGRAGGSVDEETTVPQAKTFEEKYLAFNDPTWRPTPIQKWGDKPTYPEYT